MAYFRTTFERFNFTFGKQVKQTLDVVFECDVESVEDDHYNELSAAAQEAFRQQCSGFQDPAVGVMKELGVGWSSTLGGMKFEKVEIPHFDREIEYPSEGKPVIACSFTVKDEEPFCGHVHSYRATGFYRMEKLPPREKSNEDPLQTVLLDVLSGDKDGEPRFRVIKCLPEDATIISGSGVGGCIIPIADAVIEDLVSWSDIKIKQEQGEYADRIAKYSKDDRMDDNFQLDRDWRNRMAKKLGMLT